MLNDRIIDNIITAYKHSAKRSYIIESNIDRNDIISMINTAFYASFKLEEGRQISFSLVLTDSLNWNIAKQPKIPQKRIEFEQCRELTPDNIVKLAGAFLPSESALMIRKRQPDNQIFEIWGVMFFDKRKSEFTEINVSYGEMYLNHFRPADFMINVYSKGTFTISCGHSKVGQFIDGEFIKTAPLPFHGGGMTHNIKKFYEASSISNKNGTTHSYYFRIFSELLKEASSITHGGLIIIVNSTDHIYQQFCEFKYTFKSNHIKILETFEKYNETMQSDRTTNFNINSIYFGSELQKRIRQIARLSNIDGALVIDNNFNVISFGVILKGSSWKGQVIVGHDGFNNNGQPYDISKHGTKHNSALNFIGSCPDSVAFVLSEDGPIRGFTKKDENTVYIWPNCSPTMFECLYRLIRTLGSEVFGQRSVFIRTLSPHR